jgi:hypothetical protein
MITVRAAAAVVAAVVVVVMVTVTVTATRAAGTGSATGVTAAVALVAVTMVRAATATVVSAMAVAAMARWGAATMMRVTRRVVAGVAGGRRWRSSKKAVKREAQGWRRSKKGSQDGVAVTVEKMNRQLRRRELQGEEKRKRSR